MRKTKTYCRQLLMVFIVVGCIAGCKKEKLEDTRLENTNWHSSTETAYFSNGVVDTHAMYYDAWEFLSDHKIKWTNSFGIVAHIYTGDWSLSKNDALVINVHDISSAFSRTYKIISLTDSLLKVSTEDVVIESGANGGSTKVEYEFKRF
jgi:hypothetical protein